MTSSKFCDTRLHEALAKQACWHLLHTWLPPSRSVSQPQGNCVMLPLKMTANTARFRTGQLHIIACSASIYFQLDMGSLLYTSNSCQET